MSSEWTVEEVRAEAGYLGRFADVHAYEAGKMLRAYATLLERRAEGVTDGVRVAGAMLANCAFNLAQCDRLTERERRSLDESRKAWDAVIATPPASGDWDAVRRVRYDLRAGFWDSAGMANRLTAALPENAK